jgi:hypothetical protein
MQQARENTAGMSIGTAPKQEVLSYCSGPFLVLRSKHDTLFRGSNAMVRPRPRVFVIVDNEETLAVTLSPVDYAAARAAAPEEIGKVFDQINADRAAEEDARVSAREAEREFIGVEWLASWLETTKASLPLSDHKNIDSLKELVRLKRLTLPAAG